jgi:putative PEP-CTERM system TPR-repeat lipoprotein
MLRMILRRTIAAVLAACLVLVGCEGRDADASLAAAKTYLAKNDLPAAIIELKNTLQAKPDLAEARFLLGKALLDREESVAAAVELRKASDLKFPDDQVLPLLATALLRSGEVRKVIELDHVTTLTAPDAIASLKTMVAFAHAIQGDNEKADASVTKALQANANYAPALLYRARALASAREFDAATKIVDEVISRAPDDADALALKGDLLRIVRNDAAGASELYRKALSAKPGDIAAHAALLTQLLDANDVSGARSQIEVLRKFQPRHPQTLYFQARIEAQAGNLKAAEEGIQQLLKFQSVSPQTLHLAGAVSLLRGELLRAEQHLTKLIQSVPTSASARKLLAHVYLRTGESEKALSVLAPLLEMSSPDGQTLLLAGSAQMGSGDTKKAEELFARAAKTNPTDAVSRTALAMARFQRGDASAALLELKAIADTDSRTAADLALISANINRRNFDAALKAIDQFERKQPGKPQAPLFRARVLAIRGDLAGARVNFEKALAVDSAFFPAIDGLATLDLRERKPEQARARFDAVLKVNPSDTRAMLAMATLDERAGKSKQDVAALLAKAVAIKPTDAVLRRRLIRFHMDKQDYKLALIAAQDALSALPNDADMLALLANAELAAGDINKAISSYNKLVAARPKSTAPLIALAEAHLVAKSYDAAADAVKKALSMAPDSMAVVQTAVKVDLKTGKHDQALAKARALQAKAPKAPSGWILEGDVGIASHNWPAASAAFRTALQKEDSTLIAQRLHLALRSAGDKATAEAFAVDWLRKHPQDSVFLFYLAGLAIEAKDFELATTQLEQVLRSVPDNPMVLNNLAWVQATLKKPGAVASAERVNQLMPNQPIYLDTLAYALAAEGKIARAVDVQKKALELAPPTAYGLRLNMARLYVQAGDKAAARAELDTLAKLGERFAQQNEVRELQAKL